LAPLVMLILMRGGVAYLTPVPTDLWSGLPATVILALISSVVALPLAVAIALARCSNQPALRWISAAVVETVRGVPLVTLLFMTSLVLPFLLPPDLTIERFPAALLALTLFLTAYLSEDARAGIEALPRGQKEAGAALGLSSWQNLRLVILPQALALVIQPMVGNLIGNVKNTALVAVIGLFDLTLTTRTALLDPLWRGAAVESDLFLALIYISLCAGLQIWGFAIERRVAQRGRRE
jgi:general L-amino acid transport system permease protein